jgi:hypothetical protein
MARKHGQLLKVDKDIAEKVWGHQPGRPTISRRAGRGLADAFGMHEDAGTDLFHVGLLVGAFFAKSVLGSGSRRR